MLLVLLVLLFLVLPARAQTLTGRVVGVTDGDTLTVLTPANRRISVRVFGVDAPDLRQANGGRARAFTSALVQGRPVRVIVRGRDRSGRTVGKVFLLAGSADAPTPEPPSRPAPLPNRPVDPTGAASDLPRGIPGEREAIPPPSATRAAPPPVATVTRDLSRELAGAGWAWWDRSRAPRDRTLAALERQARAARRGLWADPRPVPPWQWQR